MKTEIIIDEITYKVGDVLEHPNSKYLEHKIMAITDRSVLVNYKITSEGVTLHYDQLIELSHLKHWKIKKPKKKVVIERWINVYKWGVIVHEKKDQADNNAGLSRIACEHFYKEYEIEVE